MDIAALKVVLDAGHPVTGAYDADATVAAAQGNLVNLEEDVEFIDDQVIFESVLPVDYNALTDKQLITFWGIVHMGRVKVDGTNTRLALADMFGGTDTLPILVALQTRPVSHFQKEQLGFVFPGHIENARM